MNKYILTSYFGRCKTYRGSFLGFLLLGLLLRLLFSLLLLATSFTTLTSAALKLCELLGYKRRRRNYYTLSAYAVNGELENEKWNINETCHMFSPTSPSVHNIIIFFNAESKSKKPSHKMHKTQCYSLFHSCPSHISVAYPQVARVWQWFREGSISHNFSPD